MKGDSSAELMAVNTGVPSDVDRTAGRNRAAWAGLTSVVWAGVVCAGILQYRHALALPYLGVDVRPLRGAGQVALAGRDVWAVRNFVYPPTAAVLSIPLAGVDLGTLIRAFVVGSELFLGVLAVLAVRLVVPRAPYRPVVAGVVALALLWSYVSYHALALGNVSVVLAPAVAAIAWLAGTGRWWSCCILLVATLLLKPLLVPLLLVPLLARRWLPLSVPLLAAGLLVIACTPRTGGFERLGEVVRFLLRGSVLVARHASNNLSLTGYGSIHQLSPTLLLTARTAVGVVAILACVAARTRRQPWSPACVAWLCTALLLAVYLAGNLSEVHYLYTLVPGAVAVVLSAHHPAVRALGTGALALLTIPAWGLRLPTEQAPSVAAEIVLLVAVVLALVTTRTATETVVGGLDGP